MFGTMLAKITIVSSKNDFIVSSKIYAQNYNLKQGVLVQSGNEGILVWNKGN